jgi:hypothetical protein
MAGAGLKGRCAQLLLAAGNPAIERIDIAAEELNQLLERAREALPEEDYRKLKAALETLEYLTELVADKDTTIRHLRQLLLPASKKTKAVLAKIGIEPATNTQGEHQRRTNQRRPPVRGRNSAAEFTGAHRVEVAHQPLHQGEECGKGNVYGQKEPKVLVLVVGQAPLAATVYSLERLRCNMWCWRGASIAGGRSVTDLLATLQELEHLGVGFVSLTEALDLPPRPVAPWPGPGLMTFGYSDALDIFVNGQKVFQGDATYIIRDIQFLGTVSMRGAMAPRLKKGANRAGVRVKENYGGWAAAAELADPAALSGPALAAEGR